MKDVPFTYGLLSSGGRPTLRKTISHMVLKATTFRVQLSPTTPLTATRPVEDQDYFREEKHEIAGERWTLMAPDRRSDTLAAQGRSTSTDSTLQVPDFGPTVNEAGSEIRWDKAIPGWTALQSVICLAAQPTKDSIWIRRLYIDAVTYVLKGLPANLSVEETARLQEAMPPQVQVRIQGKNAQASGNKRSALRRFTSSTVSFFVVLSIWLAPYFAAAAAWCYRLERQHQMTERAFSASIGAANTAAERGMDMGESLGRFGNGKVGMAIRSSAAYCADGLIGGVCDGMSAVNAERPMAERPITPPVQRAETPS